MSNPLERSDNMSTTQILTLLTVIDSLLENNPRLKRSNAIWQRNNQGASL
jgi:hypothetical protein